MIHRLVVDGVEKAQVEVAGSAGSRSRGLLGRDGLDGALWLSPAKQVHSFGMRFDLDVAFVDRVGLVLHIRSLPPGGLTRVVWRSHGVLEAESGSFDRWVLSVGSTVSVLPPT